MDFQSILKEVYFGNAVYDYMLVLVWLTAGLILHKVFTTIFIKAVSQALSRSEFKLSKEEYKKHLQKPFNFVLFLIFLFIAFSHIEFPEHWGLAPDDEFGVKMVISHGYYLIFAIAVTRLAIRMAVVFAEILKLKAEKTVSKQDDQLIPFILEIIKVLIIILSVLIVASNVFDINVGSLVAGLGIGGLAIALAAKESLENLFASFTIFFDKPFVVGDLVTVGDVTGVVEKVGFRSTRIRTLEKSYVTISNKQMIDANLDNLSLRTFRRVKFNVGLVYGTKAEVIRAISKRISQYLMEYEHTNNDVQVRFTEFGSSSLDIMVLYYIDTMDFDLYLKYKEEINYKIMEIVSEEGSDFAFPTQTIHLENNKA